MWVIMRSTTSVVMNPLQETEDSDTEGVDCFLPLQRQFELVNVGI